MVSFISTAHFIYTLHTFTSEFAAINTIRQFLHPTLVVNTI